MRRSNTMTAWTDIFDRTTAMLNAQRAWHHPNAAKYPLSYLACHQCQAGLVVINVVSLALPLLRKVISWRMQHSSLLTATLRN